MTKSNSSTFAALAVLAVLATSGCITLGKPPAGIYYPDYAVITGTVKPRPGAVVLVEKATASTAIDSAYMVIRTPSSELSERRDTEWRQKPADLVTEKLLEHFLASPRFGWARTSGRPIDLRVRPFVRRFDEEHGSAGWEAVFAIDLEVWDADDKPLAFFRMPEVREVATSADAAGIGDAMARAMRRGLDEAVAAVAAR